jgi:hypothetical protein
MSEKDEIMLNMWKRKLLRKEYGPVIYQGVWKVR